MYIIRGNGLFIWLWTESIVGSSEHGKEHSFPLKNRIYQLPEPPLVSPLHSAISYSLLFIHSFTCSTLVRTTTADSKASSSNCRASRSSMPTPSSSVRFNIAEYRGIILSLSTIFSRGNDSTHSFPEESEESLPFILLLFPFPYSLSFPTLFFGLCFALVDIIVSSMLSVLPQRYSNLKL